MSASLRKESSWLTKDLPETSHMPVGMSCLEQSSLPRRISAASGSGPKTGVVGWLICAK